MFFILTSPIGTLIVYEAPYFGFNNLQFWVAGAVAQLVLVLSYLVLMFPFAKIRVLQLSAAGKLLAVTAAYLIRSVTLVVLLYPEPSDWLDSLRIRIPGDLSLMLLVWIVLSVASTLDSDFRSVESEVQKVSDRLEAQRAMTAKSAKLANRQLRKIALQTLQGEMQKLLHGLRSARFENDILRVGMEIKQLVEKKVRPLSQEIMGRVDLMADLELDIRRTDQDSRYQRFRFQPRMDSRFVAGYFLGSLNVSVTVFQLSSWQPALAVQLVSLSLPFIGHSLTRAFRRDKGFGAYAGMNLMLLLTFIAYLPTLIVIHSWAEQFSSLARIQITAFLVWFMTITVISFWSTFIRLREERINQINSNQQELRRELALMDQAIWIAQRKWAYLIHGTVQSALTVASTRLMYASKIDEKLMMQTLKDVEKAKRALEQAVEFRQKTGELLRDLKNSWEGICEVHFDLTPKAEEALDASEGARTCLNEVSKELVSNAFRHGKAANVWLSVDITHDNDLKLLATNDGVPMAPDYPHGLGFSMFEELTSSWSIEAEPQHFIATIPIQSSSSESSASGNGRNYGPPSPQS